MQRSRINDKVVAIISRLVRWGIDSRSRALTQCSAANRTTARRTLGRSGLEEPSQFLIAPEKDSTCRGTQSRCLGHFHPDLVVRGTERRDVRSSSCISMNRTYFFVNGSNFGDDPVNSIRHLLRRLAGVLFSRRTSANDHVNMHALMCDRKLHTHRSKYPNLAFSPGSRASSALRTLHNPTLGRRHRFQMT